MGHLLQKEFYVQRVNHVLLTSQESFKSQRTRGSRGKYEDETTVDRSKLVPWLTDVDSQVEGLPR